VVDEIRAYPWQVDNRLDTEFEQGFLGPYSRAPKDRRRTDCSGCDRESSPVSRRSLALCVELNSELTIVFDDQAMTIGTDLDGGSLVAPFNGLVDDVRVYDRALSVSELTALQ